MALTRSAIQTVVESSTGRTDKSDLISTAIDLALEEIANDHRWRALRFLNETLSTTADSATVDMSSLGPFQVLSARVVNDATVNGYPLVFVSPQRYDKLFPDVDDTTTGYPKFCYQDGETLYLGPKPDASYTISLRYTKPLADDAENTIKGIDGAVCAYAIAYIFDSIEKFESGDRWRQRYEVALRRARRADNRVGHKLGPLNARPENPTPWLDPFVDSNAVD